MKIDQEMLRATSVIGYQQYSLGCLMSGSSTAIISCILLSLNILYTLAVMITFPNDINEVLKYK